MTRLAWVLSEVLFTAGAAVRRWAKRQPIPPHVLGYQVGGRHGGNR